MKCLLVLAVIAAVCRAESTGQKYSDACLKKGTSTELTNEIDDNPYVPVMGLCTVGEWTAPREDDELCRKHCQEKCQRPGGFCEFGEPYKPTVCLCTRVGTGLYHRK